MSRAIKISAAIECVEKVLSGKIASISTQINKGKAKFLLQDGCFLYITYNDFNEYGYQLIFSGLTLDRVRFDNFDRHWENSSNPHHFHPRFDEIGLESPMNGNPSHDLELICNLIQSKEIYRENFHF